MHFAGRLVFVIALVLGSIGGSNAASHTHTRTAPAPVTRAAPKPVAAPLPVQVTPQLLVDMQSGDVLYESAAGVPWHPASLTKLMTAYVAFEAIAEKRVSLDTRVTMSAFAVSQAPGRSGLLAGDSVTLKDALYIMIVKSANDMAVAIAETIGGSTDAFVVEMNATAQKLGLTDTHYSNVNGLPDDGQVTTARDLAVLAIDLRRTFPEYDGIFSTQMVTLGKTNLRTNNELLARFAGTTGMKTGYICASGLNIVATAARGGRELMAVVLGGSSARERDQTAAQLMLAGFSGQYASTGKSVVTIVDEANTPPVDMKPLLCGKLARAYVTQRRAAIPLGLKGQQNYLTDRLPPTIYQATASGPAAGATATQSAGADDGNAVGDGPDGAADPTTPDTPVVAMPVPKPALKRK